MVVVHQDNNCSKVKRKKNAVLIEPQKMASFPFEVGLGHGTVKLPSSLFSRKRFALNQRD